MYRKLNADSLVTTIHKLLKRIHDGSLILD